MMVLYGLTLLSVLCGVSSDYIAVDLKTNGIRFPNVNDISFPADGSFGLAWSLVARSNLRDDIGAFVNVPEVCELDVWRERTESSFWSSGNISCADGLVQLPFDLTSKFEPQTSFYWKIRPLGGTWSRSASFDIAPAAHDWEKSEWIGGASQLRTDLDIPANRKILRARAYVSGLGTFSLHINGHKVGDRLMDPGQAVYDQKVLFVTFNVTSLLHAGLTNAIGAMLGNGKWGYLDMFANRTAVGDQSGDSTRAFRMLLNVELDDGTILSGPSLSSTWKVRHGPIVYDHMWHGEIFDTRRELQGWDRLPLSLFPAGTWSPAQSMTPKAGRMASQVMEGIRIKRMVSPTNITQWNSTTVIYDFGQNMAGTTSLKLDLTKFIASLTRSAEKTLIIRVKHTEIRDARWEPFNNFYPGMEFGHASKSCSMSDWYHRKWYECANQTNALIVSLSSSREVTYTPSFTYQGFRFAELTATELLENNEEVPLDGHLSASLPSSVNIVALQAYSDIEQIGTVQIKEPTGLLQRIFNATMMSHISQLWSIPTDCPQREKRGWMGDAGITSASLQTFFDAFAFHANFLELISDNQRKGCGDQPTTTISGPCSDPVGMNGSVPDVTPFSTSPYGANPGSTDWQATFVSIAGNLLRNYGKQALPVLEKLWEPLEAFMAYYERHVDTITGLLLVGARGDWIPPPGQPFTTPTDSTAAFFHTLCIGEMAKIASALGKESEAQIYSQRLEANKKAYHLKFFNGLPSNPVDLARRCCYDSGSQTSNMYALYLKAVPKEHINATIDMLVASINDRGATSSLLSEGDGSRASEQNPSPPWGSGPHLDVGIFGTTWMFDTLAMYGKADVALAILKERSYPSFGYFIDQEATTLWETWDGDMHDIGAHGTSRNHIMYGGGVNRFLLSVSGLSLDDATYSMDEGRSWQQFLVHLSRLTLDSITCASSTRKLLLGVASVSWCREDSNSPLTLNISVPLYSKAKVVVALKPSASLQIGRCKISCFGKFETRVSSSSCSNRYMSSARCQRSLKNEQEVTFVLPAGDFVINTVAEAELSI